MSFGSPLLVKFQITIHFTFSDQKKICSSFFFNSVQVFLAPCRLKCVFPLAVASCNNQRRSHVFCSYLPSRKFQWYLIIARPGPAPAPEEITVRSLTDWEKESPPCRPLLFFCGGSSADTFLSYFRSLLYHPPREVRYFDPI